MGRSDFAHGLMEGKTQDLNKEVDSIASQVALGPAPVVFLDDEAGKGGQLEIARVFFYELHSPLLQQGKQRDLAGGADLFAGPARRWASRCPTPRLDLVPIVTTRAVLSILIEVVVMGNEIETLPLGWRAHPRQRSGKYVCPY